MNAAVRSGSVIVSAAMERAAEHGYLFLWRKSCAAELTCDRHEAPTMTLRKLQLTMIVIMMRVMTRLTYCPLCS